MFIDGVALRGNANLWRKTHPAASSSVMGFCQKLIAPHDLQVTQAFLRDIAAVNSNTPEPFQPKNPSRTKCLACAERNAFYSNHKQFLGRHHRPS